MRAARGGEVRIRVLGYRSGAAPTRLEGVGGGIGPTTGGNAVRRRAGLEGGGSQSRTWRRRAAVRQVRLEDCDEGPHDDRATGSRAPVIT
jgi:hypothetical protein